MTKIKMLKNFLLIILVFSIIFGLDYYLRSNNLIFYSSGSHKKAFINATWEMSPNEVHRANKINLNPAQINLFNLPDKDKFEYPSVIIMERYKLLEQKEHITLWGFETKVEYAFFDEKLFEYTVFLEGYNSDKMHENIISALTEKYGKGILADDKNYLHSMRWETDFERVSYWMLEKEDLGTVKLFLVGVKIIYKPMLKKISEVSQKEHKKLF